MLLPLGSVLFVGILMVAATVQGSDQYSCYFPDKSLDLKSFACNVTAAQNGGASACCYANDLCFKSGACYQDWSGVMYRQGCTDPTFRDPACPKMCLRDGMYSLYFELTLT